MDLFEYQARDLFAAHGVPVLDGLVATTPAEARAAAEQLLPGAGLVVVKAQVKTGGRGKAGGIKLANNADEVRLHAGNILGMDIKGHRVNIIWVEHASDIAEEYYASFTLDRSAKKYLGMLSAQGGVEIEAVAESDPDAIAKIWIDPVDGLTEEAARQWVSGANLNPDATEGAVDILGSQLVAAGAQRRGRRPSNPVERRQRLGPQVDELLVQQAFDAVAHAENLAVAAGGERGIDHTDQAGVDRGGGASRLPDDEVGTERRDIVRGVPH